MGPKLLQLGSFPVECPHSLELEKTANYHLQGITVCLLFATLGCTLQAKLWNKGKIITNSYVVYVGQVTNYWSDMLVMCNS